MNLARKLVVSALALASTAGVLAAQKPVAIYHAQAINLDLPTGAQTGPVQIQIARWSTDAERDQMLNTLLEQGPERLLASMAKQPRIGTIRTPDTVGYDLKYARRTPLANGAEQVVIITDRPVGFWERRYGPPSVDYPFTVIEMRINSAGQGEGKLSVATKILGDKASRSIALENYSVGPVLLQNVRRDNN
jgi:hypothetical protein